MSITNPTQSGTGFLSFNSLPPRVWLTSASQDIPERIYQYWKEEGYDTTYLPYNPAEQKAFLNRLKTLHDDLELGETYALVAYGEAATACLKAALKPIPRCCALVTYYPTVLPSAKTKFPHLMNVVVHVAGNQVSPDPTQVEWKCHRYDGTKIGFAEPGHRFFQEVEADLAWSRTLGSVRKGFKRDVDLETPFLHNLRGKYENDVPENGSLQTVQTMTQASPHVTIVPTLTGGLGRKKLEEFYREFFIPSLVPDFDMRLISRTIGVDRVVDEMIVSFTHTDEIDWILPGVPPTDKPVEVAVVSIVGIRGGKLTHEHLYWDQASVLVQVGLLDPKIFPKSLKQDGLKRLPINGAEAARQLVEPKPERYNELLREHGLLDGINGA